MRGDKRIIIDFVDSKDQRYPTCGDYYEKDGVYHITVTKQIDHRYNLLIMLHEMIEWTLTEMAGIREEDISDFDIEWNREPREEDEPGNNRYAPYYREHRIAENFERLFADYLQVDFLEYEKLLII